MCLFCGEGSVGSRERPGAAAGRREAAAAGAARRSGGRAGGLGAAGFARHGIHHRGPNQLILINCQQ
jgi:hypothetical protein